MILDKYNEYVLDSLSKTVVQERQAILSSARIIADVIKRKGLVYTFGTGHSHLIAEEVFYRAGGLVPVYAIIEDGVSGNHEVTKSEYTERLSGYAKHIINYHKPTKNDCMIIISNSGRNSVPIEMAIECKERGISTIAITSIDYSKNQSSRHFSGKRLFELCDIVCDNHSLFGDATLKIDGLDQSVGPTSNITSNYLIHAMITQGIELAVNDGASVDVFYSGNLDGAREKNDVMLEKYWSRIRTW